MRFLRGRLKPLNPERLVGTYVGSSIAALTSQGFLVVMMIGGAIGFYLGIDTPPVAFHDQMVSLQKAVPVERLMLQNFSVP